MKEDPEGAPSGVAGKHQVRGTSWFLSTECMCMKLVSFLVNPEGCVVKSGEFMKGESFLSEDMRQITKPFCATLVRAALQIRVLF